MPLACSKASPNDVLVSVNISNRGSQPASLHGNGLLPAYEWNFSDVNPPVHAWAAINMANFERAQTGKASHQTGWIGVIPRLLQLHGSLTPETVLASAGVHEAMLSSTLGEANGTVKNELKG